MEIQSYQPIHGHFSKGHFIKASRPIDSLGLTEFNSPRVNTIDPSQHGPIAQLINNKYLFELRKDVKRVFLGKRLKAILNRTYSYEDFKKLPESIKNLIRFHKSMSTTEIIRFMEFLDKSHEISFRDYNFDKVQFKALFAALGDLQDVEMLIGHNNYVSLSDDFEVKKKIREAFTKVRDTIFTKRKSRKKINGGRQSIQTASSFVEEI